MTEEREMTALDAPVGAGAGQSSELTPTIIPDYGENFNPSAEEMFEAQMQYEQEMQAQAQADREAAPGFMQTVSMPELYEMVYPGKPPIIEHFLYPGTYLFVGAPKVGKSFMMAQIAYARQKRSDRMIHSSYYEHLFGVKPCNTVRTAADKRKSFYEDVVQIGKMEDSGYGTDDFQLVADCLKEYMEGFQNRNPNFYVFNAVLHMDEATPHLHIDYIPVGHYKRGQDVQNGIAQALKEMGYGEGKMAIAKWRAAEVEVLNKICLEHGIKPLAPEKARGTLEIPRIQGKTQTG